MGTGKKIFCLYKYSTLGRESRVSCWRPQRGYSKIQFNGRLFSLKHREAARPPSAALSLAGDTRWEPGHGTKREFLLWFHRREHSPTLLRSGGIRRSFGVGYSLGRAVLDPATRRAAPHPSPRLSAPQPPGNVQGCPALPEGHIQAHSSEKKY